MSFKCNHDQRFSGVFGCVNGCIACELEDAKSECRKLLDAIVKHHSQKADDRCIEDDDELYAAAGLLPCDRRIGDPFEMIANCVRFVKNRCTAGGPWKSYAELEQENIDLRDAVKLNISRIVGIDWDQISDDSVDADLKVVQDAKKLLSEGAL